MVMEDQSLKIKVHSLIVNIKMDNYMDMVDILIKMDSVSNMNIQIIKILDHYNDLFVYFIVFIINFTVFIIFYY